MPRAHPSLRACSVASVMSDSAKLWAAACWALLSKGFTSQEYWSGLPCPPPGDCPNPGIEPRSPALQADSLLSEPPEKPKNIGVGSLTFLQETFPTQKLNWGLLHCRRSLYQLSCYAASKKEKDSKVGDAKGWFAT